MLRVLLVLAALLTARSAEAASLVISFSFLNTTGNVAGRVAGHLVFDTNGSNVAATALYIDSTPAGGSFYPAASNLLPQFEKAGLISANRFTLVKGVVKKGVFSGVNEMDQISFGLNAPGGSNYLGYGGSNFTRNEFGFMGVDYSVPGETRSVVEPGTAGVLVAGLLSFGAVLAVRKRRVLF